MPVIDHDKISDIIREVAADKIEPRFRQLAEDEIQIKTSPTDLVTIADIEAEIELTRILKDVLPGSQVVGEEVVSKGDVLRDVIGSYDGPVWVVDPVDGTNNFASGNPVFGTMVALVDKGERVASWIYQVPTKRMVTAQKGGGVRIGGQPLPDIQRPLPNADFSTLHAFISRKFVPPKMRPFIDEKVKLLANATTYMCCAWEYVQVLEGDAAFSVYKRIEPWDHLAGVLLLEEAGFYIRKWDGTPYLASDLEGGLVNAPSEEIWQRAHKHFVADPLKEVQRIL